MANTGSPSPKSDREVKPTVKDGEGDWAQVGMKKKWKKVKAVTNANVVISRVRATNGKVVNLQTPMHTGPGFEHACPETPPTVAPEKDKHVDLAGMNLSP